MRKQKFGNDILACARAVALEDLDLRLGQRLPCAIVNDLAVRARKDIPALLVHQAVLDTVNCRYYTVAVVGRCGGTAGLIFLGEDIGVEFRGRYNTDTAERFAILLVQQLVREVVGSVDYEIAREEPVLSE